MTGVLFWSAEVGDKRLQLLQATMPALKRVAVLRDPSVPNTLDRLEAMQGAAAQRQLDVIPVEAQSANELATPARWECRFRQPSWRRCPDGGDRRTRSERPPEMIGKQEYTG